MAKKSNNAKLITNSILVILWLFMFTPTVFASQHFLDGNEIKNITASWQCKWCPYKDKSIQESEINVGAGYVSNDSYKHGDYTGLNEEGGYLIADVNYKQRTGEAISVDVKASNMGLDSRTIEVGVDSHGFGDLTILYDELPKLNSDTARTPYNGNTVQTLPSSWFAGSTTANMTELSALLHDVDIKTQRKKIAVSANYYQSPGLSYGLSFQRETKEGNKTAGLALGDSFATARGVILAIPVDYITNQGNIQLNYTKSNWHASIGYKFSDFKNENSYIRWENPFSQPTGVDEGQAAQEPSNMMQQIFLFGSYKISSATTSTAKITIGRLEQDDSFLPYTINSSLSPVVLPRTSLNGEINTYNGVISVVSKINSKLRLQAQYLQNEQDNDTARATYDHIIADTTLSASSASRANFPYGFKQKEFGAEAHYKLMSQHKFLTGYEHTSNNRTHQDVEETDENSVWGKYKFALKNQIEFSIQLTRQERDGSNYQADTEILPEQNSSLRKYNLGNRNRNKVSSVITYLPDELSTLSFYVNYAKDDYSDSELGLIDSEQKDYTISFQYETPASTMFNIDYSLTDIYSRQAGSQIFASPTWYANNDEQIDVINFGINRQIYPNKLEIGLNFSYSNSRGDITMSNAEAFPTLKAELHTITLNGKYKLKNNSSVTLLLRYERYTEENWAADYVTSNTLNNVLTLGEVSPSYNIGIIAATYNYNF